MTLRISDVDDLSELGFLSFSQARSIAARCTSPEKLLPHFHSLGSVPGRPDETDDIRRWIEEFRPDAVVASHGSEETLEEYRKEGVSLISAWEELSSDMDDELIGRLIEGTLNKGWDIVDLYVYPNYEDGWDLLTDEFRADLSDLESLVSRYPLFVSLDVKRDTLDAVQSSLSKALGIIFECRTDCLPFGGNSNVFNRAQILEFAEAF